jgi:hypothetical protein
MRGEEGRWNGCCFVGDKNEVSGGGAFGTTRPLEGGLGSRFSDEAMILRVSAFDVCTSWLNMAERGLPSEKIRRS